MRVEQMIERLQEMPAYYDVVFTDSEEEGAFGKDVQQVILDSGMVRLR